MRNVIVTGGSGGIGRAVVDRFNSQGDRAYGFDIVGGSEVIECDVTSETSVKTAFDYVQAEAGPIDILINAAGRTGRGNIIEETSDEWRLILDINLTGAFLCSRLALADMIPRRQGWIVNIASVNARFGGSALSGPAYAASKGGLVTLTRFIAREHAADGIQANSVAPGPHDTPMWQALDETQRQTTLDLLPGGGIGEAADLAGVITFLCSGDAQFINGATIDVNGGQWTG